MNARIFAACAFGALSLAGAARAGETMFGAFGHDLGPADRERNSADFQFGYRTDPLTYDWTKWIFHPQVHFLGSLNTRYTTDFIAVGVDWRVPVFKTRFYVRPGIGIAYTNGEYNLPPANAPNLTPAEYAYRYHLYKSRIDFGDPVLFEPELAAGYQITRKWSAEISWTHLSNGQILHQGKNQGLDDVGLRAVYHFGK